jgi:hypothetical protein
MRHTIQILENRYVPVPGQEGDFDHRDVKIVDEKKVANRSDDESIFSPAVRIINEKMTFIFDLTDDGTIRIIHEKGSCLLRQDEDSVLYLIPEDSEGSHDDSKIR